MSRSCSDVQGLAHENRVELRDLFFHRRIGKIRNRDDGDGRLHFARAANQLETALTMEMDVGNQDIEWECIEKREGALDISRARRPVAQIAQQAQQAGERRSIIVDYQNLGRRDHFFSPLNSLLQRRLVRG